jgi:hypothetical protein
LRSVFGIFAECSKATFSRSSGKPSKLRSPCCQRRRESAAAVIARRAPCETCGGSSGHSPRPGVRSEGLARGELNVLGQPGRSSVWCTRTHAHASFRSRRA